MKEASEESRVAALVPAFNETDRITSVVAEAATHLPVIVVDDGSTDDTACQAKTAGATVLRLTPNQGKGAALQAGFRHALHAGYDAVVTLDADGQHDPSEIPALLSAYAARHGHLVIGVRDFDQMPIVRRLANSLGQRTFSWALRRPILDNQSGYRLISRQVMEAMLTNNEPGFEFEVEMIVTCVREGFTLDWVPIRTIYTGQRSHINGLQHLIKFLRIVWQTRRATRRYSTREPKE